MGESLEFHKTQARQNMAMVLKLFEGLGIEGRYPQRLSLIRSVGHLGGLKANSEFLGVMRLKKSFTCHSAREIAFCLLNPKISLSQNLPQHSNDLILLRVGERWEEGETEDAVTNGLRYGEVSFLPAIGFPVKGIEVHRMVMEASANITFF